MSGNFRFQIFDMRSLKQSTLNFGQKSNQTSNLNQCVECGMIFCANEKKDTDLTTEEKQVFQQTMDEFVSDVSDFFFCDVFVSSDFSYVSDFFSC